MYIYTHRSEHQKQHHLRNVALCNGTQSNFSSCTLGQVCVCVCVCVYVCVCVCVFVCLMQTSSRRQVYVQDSDDICCGMRTCGHKPILPEY